MKEKYDRKVQRSVTLFICHNDDYLFLKRSADKRVDPGRLNGVGGRVESGENYLETAIREVKEETGYIIDPSQVKLSGVVTLEGGYAVDWVMCFFKISVSDKTIPLGNKTEDGEFVWLNKDKVLDSDYELVDDLNYCFKEIVEGKDLFFLTAKLQDDQKIFEVSMSKIKNS